CGTNTSLKSDFAKDFGKGQSTICLLRKSSPPGGRVAAPARRHTSTGGVQYALRTERYACAASSNPFLDTAVSTTPTKNGLPSLSVSVVVATRSNGWPRRLGAWNSCIWNGSPPLVLTISGRELIFTSGVDLRQRTWSSAMKSAIAFFSGLKVTVA